MATDSAMGALLEHHRTDVLRISIRDASERAGISEPTWRRVVKGGTTTVRNLVAMAVAVGADPGRVLQLGGHQVSADSLAAILAEREHPHRPGPVDDLAAEIERIEHLRLPARARLAMLRALVNLHAEVAAEDEREGRTA